MPRLENYIHQARGNLKFLQAELAYLEAAEWHGKTHAPAEYATLLRILESSNQLSKETMMAIVENNLMPKGTNLKGA